MSVKGIAAIAAMIVSASLNAAGAETLPPDLIEKIHATTFEVVAAKPVNDPLTYEKPLPFELLPYQIRTDKYYSIGTAFSIGGNRFVTAGHVLTADLAGSWGPPVLRDAGGHIYAIDKIEKFSLERDFAVFSLVGAPDAAPLGTNVKPDLNSTVYTVGNALGEGLVVRDGLYTSNTPEDEEGRWNFMRFSAAASPGNSGGPLLDKAGRIVGIVLRKSQNENLNYALPVAEILNAPDHVAEADSRVTSKVDLFDSTQIGKFKTEFALPLSFPDFAKTYLERSSAIEDRQLADLLAKEADNLFPNGPGAQRALHALPALHPYPALLTRNNDGLWAPQAKPTITQLPANGFVAIGAAGHSLMFHWHRPGTVSAKESYASPDKLMGDLLTTGFLHRNVGSENIKVTGLGKPSEDSVYTDRWQRRWQVRIWPLPDANAVVIAFALPMPDGYSVIAQVAPASQQHDHMIDLELLTGFIAAAYEGTVAQWKEFLTERPLLPGLFDDLKVDFSDGGSFRFASNRLSFSVPQEVLAVTRQSVLTLGLGYYPDRGKVVWDAGVIQLKRTSTDNDWINIQRHIRASDDLPDVMKSVWDKVSHGQHPYDGVPRTENDVTKVTAVVAAPPGDDSTPLYTAFVGMSGVTSPEAMKAKLETLLKDFQVKER